MKFISPKELLSKSTHCTSYKEYEFFGEEDKNISNLDENKEDEQRIAAANTNYVGMAIGLAFTGFSLFILFLWVRWLYNTGAPKTE